MKAKLGIVCSLVLVLSFSVQAAEIPGGIVYSNGKNVVYYDLKTGQETNLVSDLNPGNLKLAAISADGKVLVWIKNRVFWAKLLPDGKPFLLPTKRLFPRRSRHPDVKNLSVSADKHFIVFQMRGMIQERKREVDWVKLRKQAKRMTVPGKRYPTPMKPIKFFEITRSFAIPIKVYIRGGSQEVSLRSYGGWQHNRDNAYFPVWSKNGETLALIFQKPGIWGPIEIYYDCSPNFLCTRGDGMRSRHPWETLSEYKKYRKEYKKNFEERIKNRIRRKKIKLVLRSCEGLAWRPYAYGTTEIITWLSGGKVYSENGEVIARGIRGSNLSWITNDSFIFRGTDGTLYFWKQRKIKKLMKFVPEQFSYCSRPSLAVDVVTAGKESKGKDRVRLVRGNEFHIGTIKTGVMMRTVESIYIKTGINDLDPYGSPQKQLEFAFPNEKDIKDIEDPSQYDYKTIFLKMWRGGLPPCITVPLNQIVLLKDGNRYAAIKPVKLEPHKRKGKPVYQESSLKKVTIGAGGTPERRKYLEELVKRTRQRERQERSRQKGPMEWLVYEWKYWPDEVVALSLKKK